MSDSGITQAGDDEEGLSEGARYGGFGPGANATEEPTANRSGTPRPEDVTGPTEVDANDEPLE